MKNKEHEFTFDFPCHGKEKLTLTTNVEENGNFINQELELLGCCNSVSLLMVRYVFNPDTLRKLANELEAFMISSKYEKDDYDDDPEISFHVLDKPKPPRIKFLDDADLHEWRPIDNE